MAGPLEGVRIVDLSVNVLGPVGTMILGDQGADVIKVEAPEGDPMRRVGPAHSDDMGALFLNINRNKRSIVLDLKKPAARQALMRLVAGADVFVHNMRSKAAARLGVDHDSITSRNPKIIYCSASGFREDGRYGDRPAYDDVIQGASGIAALNMRSSGTPRYIPMIFVDKFCGCMLASAVTTALFNRERSGAGCRVQVPMFETITWFNLLEHFWYGALGQPELGLGYPRMFGSHHRPLATKDGHLCLVASTDAQWRRLFVAIGRPELAEDPRFATMRSRTENIVEAYRILGEQLGARTTAEWQAELDAADIANGPMNDLIQLISDPHLADVGFFEHHEHPTEGTLVTMPLPVVFSGLPGRVRLLPPRLGEHTAQILQSLGYDRRMIADVAG